MSDTNPLNHYHPIMGVGAELNSPYKILKFQSDMKELYDSLEKTLESVPCVDLDITKQYQHMYNLKPTDIYDNMMRYRNE